MLKATLCCGAFLLAAAARGQSDASFERRLAGVESGAKPRPRSAGFWDLFKTPEPSRVPSPQEIDPDAQKVITDGSRLYFLDQGRIFEKSSAEGPPARLPGSRGAEAILLYKGTLVARRTSGRVFLWDAEHRQWLDIGNRARDLRAAGDDLVALTFNGELWVYQGAPGPVNLTFIYTPMPGGGFVMLPNAAGRQVAFVDSKVKGVDRLAPSPDGLTVIFSDGRSAEYSTLGIPSPSAKAAR